MGHRQPLDCVGLDISLYFHLFFLVRLLKLVFILSIHQKSREWTPPRLYEWSLSRSIFIHTNIKQTMSPRISDGKSDRFNLFVRTLVPEIEWKCLMECPLFLITSVSGSCKQWEQNHKVAPTRTYHTHAHAHAHAYYVCIDRRWTEVVFSPLFHLFICEQEISKGWTDSEKTWWMSWVRLCWCNLMEAGETAELPGTPRATI